jgi:lipopolysaccharide export LptBFGC system permease protein LptF
LGHNEVLSPIVAAWLPNVAFAVVGIIFVIKAEV